MDKTMYAVLEDARQDLKERFTDLVADEKPRSAADLEALSDRLGHDTVFEVADSNVPIYTYDLLTLAADELALATEEPELGPAFDGSPTPTNIIAANVFERIEQELAEYWQKLMGEAAEAFDEDDDEEDDDPDPDGDDPGPVMPANRLPVAQDGKLFYTCARCERRKARMYGDPPGLAPVGEQAADLLAAARHELVCRVCRMPALTAA